MAAAFFFDTPPCVYVDQMIQMSVYKLDGGIGLVFHY